MDHRVRYLTDSSKLSRMGRCELSSTKTIKNDLRWRRTERSLMSSLGTQLSRTPLDKVKVTELCRDADVSKATFYLHYCDIYDLADAFVDARVETVIDELGDPCLPFQDVGSFVRRFVEVFTSDDQKRFLKLADENHMAPRFLNRFWRKLGEKLESCAPVPDEERARIAMSFVIGGLVCAVQSDHDVDADELVDTLARLMTATRSAAPEAS